MDKVNKYLTEEKKFNTPVVIAKADDWEGVYIKGKLYTEGHEITKNDLIESLEKSGSLKKNSLSEFYVNDKWIKNIGRLPKNINEVEWE